MPYFERKPWQELVEPVVQSSSRNNAANTDFAEVAQSILASESLRKQGASGPYRCRNVIAPGEQGLVVLSIAAQTDGAPVALRFTCDDLSCESGQTMSSHHISMAPEHLVVNPGGREVLEVKIAVPEQADPGAYLAKVVGDGSEPLEFDVEFEVSPTD